MNKYIRFDQTVNNQWRASIVGQTDYWAAGESKTLALGNLIMRYPQVFGLSLIID